MGDPSVLIHFVAGIFHYKIYKPEIYGYPYVRKPPYSHSFHTFFSRMGPQFVSVQLVYKWLKSMVYGRQNELDNYDEAP